jgi:hypothetical protein
MGPRNQDSWRRARTLREQGWALRPIANEVGVALSTVSLWVRDIAGPLAASPQIAEAEPSSAAEVHTASEVRHCGKCARDLPLTSFNRHPTGRQWWCRDCCRAYFRARAHQHRKDVKAARQKRRRAARIFLADYLATKCCSDCGEADARVLEFHHLRGKVGNVADLVGRGLSPRALQYELAKCSVLCACCHRLRTAASGGSWRLAPERLESDRCLAPGERRNLVYVRDLLMKSRCVDCGESRLVVLEFDHVERKDANVVGLARRGCALWRLEAEIARCEVRCVNCHRRRTWSLAMDAGQEPPTV